MPLRSGLWFSVLGPIRAWSGTRELDLGTPQCRLTLAALLLREGGSVLVEELVEALWAQTPPRSAVPGVRTFVSRLRRSLGEAGHGDLIQARQGTYRLITEESTLDVRHLRRQVQLAHRQQDEGDLNAAATSLRLGLAQWQGTPLGGAEGPFAEQQRTVLQRLRLSALEQCASVDLARDEPGSAVAMLSPVISEYPFDERLTELLMLGLLRTGRPADALRLFHSTSRLLDDELGVRPGPALQAVHQKILQSRPVAPARPPQRAAIRRPAPAARLVDAAPVRPLPRSSRGFTGRTELIGQITQQVREQVGGSGTACIGLTGLTGTGKTALAVELASHLKDHFPDGQVFASLRERDDRPLAPAQLLPFLLMACGTPASEVPKSMIQQARHWRELLRRRRVLVILDDAQDAQQVAPLLPGSGDRTGSVVLVTSQCPLRDTAVRAWWTLPPLPTGEAVDLLRELLGPDRVNLNPQAARQLVSRLSGLPFALRYAAALLKARPHWSLGSERVTALVLAGAGTDSAAPPAQQLQRAYRRLPEELARAFSLMSLADGGRISVPAAALLLDVGQEHAEDLLEALVDRGLMIRRTPLSYEYLSLIREYAWTVAVVEGCPEDAADPSRIGLISA